MENSEFEERVKELVSLVDFSITPKDACWFDGGTCPYGVPEGKFQLRPTQFCHLDTHGCHKLLASKAEFEISFGINEEGKVELGPEVIKQILEDEVPKLVDKNCPELSGFLMDISLDGAENFSAAERKILELAAGILANSGSSDPKILTEDFDFEDFNL